MACSWTPSLVCQLSFCLYQVTFLVKVVSSFGESLQPCQSLVDCHQSGALAKEHVGHLAPRRSPRTTGRPLKKSHTVVSVGGRPCPLHSGAWLSCGLGGVSGKMPLGTDPPHRPCCHLYQVVNGRAPKICCYLCHKVARVLNLALAAAAAVEPAVVRHQLCPNFGPSQLRCGPAPPHCGRAAVLAVPAQGCSSCRTCRLALLLKLCRSS
mmetsp:Transcript_50288/g.89443  ORF Transcript_50288/g.89443 Transcript_50288/m.89443 type:complete len:209 (-) Transcript_50288:52-678(-)